MNELITKIHFDSAITSAAAPTAAACSGREANAHSRARTLRATPAP